MGWKHEGQEKMMESFLGELSFFCSCIDCQWSNRNLSSTHECVTKVLHVWNNL